MVLPKYVTNLLQQSTVSSTVRNLGFILLILSLKVVRYHAHYLFLQHSVNNRSYPKHVTSSVHLSQHIRKDAAITRKMNSLLKEICLCEMRQWTQGMRNLNQQRCFNWDNLRRSTTSALFLQLTQAVQYAMNEEAVRLFSTHSRKWAQFGGGSGVYNINNMYFIDILPVFPFDKNSISGQFVHYSYNTCADITSNRNAGDYTNMSNTELPKQLVSVINKGPKFCVPYTFNQNFWRDLHLSLSRGSFGFKWASIIDKRPNSKLENAFGIIPFSRNTVSFPRTTNESLDKDLLFLNRGILNIYQTETRRLQNERQYQQCQADIKCAKRFLSDNNLTVVESDKTQRVVVCPINTIKEESLNVLADNSTYKTITSSKVRTIEKQANQILEGLQDKLSLSKYDLQKLKVDGTKPANFHCTVKDHKPKNSNGIFPLRPIASIHSTPVDTLDWIVAKLLGQLLQFVTAHLPDAQTLVRACDDIGIWNDNFHFISLDVVNLYPSIPISLGIDSCLSLFERHMDGIDNCDISKTDLNNMLTFLCYNYEIRYGGITVKQVRGVPMGARFAPPFAIISMHCIETEALIKLSDIGIHPRLYLRYIDDIILGPVPFDTVVHNDILSCFNAVNQHIQFTMEAPEPNTWLPFLDLQLNFNNGHLNFRWYTKQCHSGNALHSSSHHTSITKRNYLFNDIRRVLSRCSNDHIKTVCLKEVREKYDALGYSSRDVDRAMHRANCWNKKHQKMFNPHKPVLKLPFVSDKATRLVKSHLQRSKLDFNLVFRHGPNVMGAIGTQVHQTEKCISACTVCDSLPPYAGCNTKYLVYEYICRLCNHTYIGYSARSLKYRHAEHKRSINKGDNVSALSTHLKNSHGSNQAHNIECYNLRVLQRCTDTVSASLAENYHIQHRKPQINRKHEGCVFDIV